MTRHGRFLNDLGGKTALATVLGLRAETVKSWYKRGIPAKFWHRIAALNPRLTPEELARTKPGERLRTPAVPLRGRRRAARSGCNGHRAAAE